MSSVELDPRAGELLLQIAERHAFRHHAAVNLRGHGLQYLGGSRELREYLQELDFHLGLLEDVERIHGELGGQGLDDAVMLRLERVPYPASRLELSCCLSVTRRGERAAAKSYVECVHPGFADVARRVLEAERGTREEDILVDFCRHEDQRAIAQEYWSRWIRLSLGSVGRIGTRTDQLTVELGLRDRPAEEVIRMFLDDLEPLGQACKLSLPPLDEVEAELPEDLRSRFPTRKA